MFRCNSWGHRGREDRVQVHVVSETSHPDPERFLTVQLAALDFIVSSAADLFAMTDPGSQLSNLVTGMRIYHGRGKLPTLRPDKRQLAAALAEHRDVEWHVFVNKVGQGLGLK